MSPPASGDARPTSRHAAGGRRAAGRGSGNDPGRRSGDSASSPTEVTDSGDDLGIASWLDSGGPARDETGPLLSGLGLTGPDAGTPLWSDPIPAPAADRVDGRASGPVDDPAEAPAAETGRPASKHAAGSSRAPEPGRSAESRHAPEPGRSAAETGRSAAESRLAPESGRAAEAGRVAHSRHAGESRHAAAPAPADPAPGTEARWSGPVATPAPSARAEEPAASARPGESSARLGEPDRAGESGDEPAAGHRASKHAGGRRAANRGSGPVAAAETPAAAPSAPAERVFGTPFWSGPSQTPEPDPDDPLGLGTPERPAAEATRAEPTRAPGRRAASRTSGPVADHAAAAPAAGHAAAPGPVADQYADRQAAALAGTQAWPAPPPSQGVGGRRATARRADPVAEPVPEPPTTFAFAPDQAPVHPLDADPDTDDAPARTGGGTHGRAPSTRPRRTGDDPPGGTAGRATGGALAACLVVAAVLGFAGGAWFGSRDDGSDPAGDARTSDQDTPGAGEPVPPAEGLTLTADPVGVAPNDLIALAGTLAPAEGGIEVSLQHRVGDGEWVDYPASRPLTFTTRADGSFSGSVATDAPGPNFFRVVNVDDAEEVSNELEVTVAE